MLAFLHIFSYLFYFIVIITVCVVILIVMDAPGTESSYKQSVPRQ